MSLLELGAHRRIDLGKARIERLNRVDDRRRHDQAREPLAIGGHDVPRRHVGGGVANHVFVGRHVGGKVRALADIGRRELPVLLGLVEALEEALALFVLRHVQEELADQHALPREVALVGVDVFEALAPDVLGDELRRQLLLGEDVLVDADDQRLLVVRAIEDADVAAARQPPVRAPQKIVIELFGSTAP